MATASALGRVNKRVGPIALRAKVVRGFGRGSKMLGFPTANMEIKWEGKPDDLSEDEKKVLDFATNHETGIYAALACVEDGNDKGIYKAAVSVGWNPTFTDVAKKTIEPWILHDYDKDFYDCNLRLLVIAYTRPEEKFNGLDELIDAIKTDGVFCSDLLDTEEFVGLIDHTFFKTKAV
eukprot:m.196061 g.196061  ORF g.196061 m.196061 type:complete len:178 (-) comp32602_c3_seq1:34-567(-)